MTELTNEEVKHIAGLANIKLSEVEVEKFVGQLSETISFIEKLNELDTKNVSPTSQTTGLKNIFRKDEVRPSLTQEEALSGTKNTHRGYFVTKSVFG